MGISPKEGADLSEDFGYLETNAEAFPAKNERTLLSPADLMGPKGLT